MQKIDLDDTIAAISTPIGEGGIGIVRLSGKDSLAIADKIFVSKDGKKASEYETYTTHYGYVVASRQSLVASKKKIPNQRPATRDQRQDIIDEVLLTVMKAPKSYTKEDIVEINCHGGIVPLKKVLELVLSAGARIAEPGEFTKRAFLNGRIDLAQAEAVLDIISAKTQKGLELALLQLGGGLSGSIKQMRERLLDVKVGLEAAVDFPDEELAVDSGKGLFEKLNNIRIAIKNLMDSSEAGRIIRDGITVVICGKPNVGKSSLLNEFLKEERAIVTPVPGTTRDAIAEYANIDGIPMRLIDTAGIVKTRDPVEKEGVIRSKLYIERADLILFMMDAGGNFSDEDREIIELIKTKEVICLLNKIDIKGPINIINKSDLGSYFGRAVGLVEISILEKINLDGLRRAITDAVWKGRVFASDFNILVNARHKDALAGAMDFVDEALDSLSKNRTEEIVSISIDGAAMSLGEVTGDSVSEEALNRIFSRFCVGK